VPYIGLKGSQSLHSVSSNWHEIPSLQAPGMDSGEQIPRVATSLVPRRMAKHSTDWVISQFGRCWHRASRSSGMASLSSSVVASMMHSLSGNQSHKAVQVWLQLLVALLVVLVLRLLCFATFVTFVFYAHP